MSEQAEREPAESGPGRAWPRSWLQRRGKTWPPSWLPTSGRAWPYVVGGVCALLVTGLLAYLTLRDAGRADPGSGAVGQTVRTPATERVVHRQGGFAVAAPTRMPVTREGRTLRLVTRDRSLVVTVGPGAQGPLPGAHRSFLGELRDSYRDVSLIGTERTRVDDRAAVSTAGQGVNSSRVRIRFVVVTVAARPRNFTIAAYTAHDSDPARTLPLVNAIANGFEVLP